MITTQQILWGIVYPALLAGVILVIAHLRRRGRRDTHPWGVPLAVSAGLTVAFIGISGRLNIPPTQGQEWVVVAAAAAFIVSIIASVHERTRWIVLGLSILVLIGLAYFAAANRKPYIPAKEFWSIVGIFAAGMVVWFLAMEPLAVRYRGIPLPLLLSGTAGAAALVLVNGHTQRLGQIVGGVACVLLIVAVLAIWLRDLSLVRGGILTTAVAVFGLLLCGYLYADVTWPQIAILAAAPLAAWIAVLPPVRSRRRWLRFTIVAIPVLAILAFAAVPAAKGLRKTMQEQTESYMYQ